MLGVVFSLQISRGVDNLHNLHNTKKRIKQTQLKLLKKNYGQKRHSEKTFEDTEHTLSRLRAYSERTLEIPIDDIENTGKNTGGNLSIVFKLWNKMYFCCLTFLVFFMLYISLLCIFGSFSSCHLRTLSS